jgi:hypothetical protein
MRKCIAVLVALMLVAGLAFAAPAKAKSDALTPLVGPGDFVVNAGIGWGGISGGVELNFFQVDIAKVLPVTFGAAARAFVDPGLFYDYFSFGVGALATVHVGFKDLNLPENLHWLSNVDSYAGVGIGLASMTNYDMGIGISTFEGVSYYLNEKFAIGFEYGYLGRIVYNSYYNWSWPMWYSTVGVTFKL